MATQVAKGAEPSESTLTPRFQTALRGSASVIPRPRNRTRLE